MQKLAVKKEFFLYKKKEAKRCNSTGEELYRVIPSDQESFLANMMKPTEKFEGAGKNLVFINFVVTVQLFLLPGATSL